MTKFSEAVAGGWAPQSYWDQYTDLAKAQAEHKIAKEVEHVIARSAERSAFEPMDACDAYDAWHDQARGELERDLISARTREGLAAAKAKGIVPGSPRSQVPEE